MIAILIRGWLALLAVASLAYVSCALAQGTTIYKCTDAKGKTAFSDKPCATLPPGATAGTGEDGTRQEVLRQPATPPASTSADMTFAMCAKNEGSKATDETIKSLPEAQRQAVTGVLRGLIAGMARDPGAQEILRRVTLTIDASRTAVICVPQRRAQVAGAAGQATVYIAFRVEPNGRTVTLQPSAPPIVHNDANEPTTVAARCSSMVVSCVRSQGPGPSIDECLEKQPVCPSGRLDPAEKCCPQACKDAFRRERAAGADAQTAFIKVLFGDASGAVSCVPGMPRKG